uniref:Uncharacterized protein n=1 Tax=Lepeophtheirus salmonis TaxID=72036 RepID=A0A0K2URK4_LEPSM
MIIIVSIRKGSSHVKKVSIEVSQGESCLNSDELGHVSDVEGWTPVTKAIKWEMSITLLIIEGFVSRYRRGRFFFFFIVGIVVTSLSGSQASFGSHELSHEITWILHSDRAHHGLSFKRSHIIS